MAVFSADRKSTRLNSSHANISYAVFCLIARPPASPLFPYTTLFRSRETAAVAGALHQRLRAIGIVFVSAQRLVETEEAGGDERVGDEAEVGVNVLVQAAAIDGGVQCRSEEHTSELQSRQYLVCRLLLDSAATGISTLSLHDALPIS